MEQQPFDQTLLALIARLPKFVRRVLIVSGPPILGKLFEARGIEAIDCQVEGALPEGNAFDAIIGDDCGAIQEILARTIARLLPALSPHGYLILGREPAVPLDGTGMVPYTVINEPSGTLFVGARSTYNPVTHARDLLDAGHPDWAFEVLDMIPATYLQDRSVQATVVSEKMLCLFEVDSRLGDAGRLDRFAESQAFFYHTIGFETRAHLFYQCQAEFWNRIGRPDMAARLLQSIHYTAPDEATRRQLCSYKNAAKIEQEEAAPEWQPTGVPPRILFITHPRPHYGLDVLYDGLKTVLGSDNMIEFPYKPSLHDGGKSTTSHYPCTFKWPGERYDLDQIIELLHEKQFDLILYGDFEYALDCETARKIVHATSTPLFLLDEQDECNNTSVYMAQFLDKSDFVAYFKREMLAGTDYGPRARPMPFAYPDGRIPKDFNKERIRDVFWAGHRQVGLRRLYLEHIEQRLKRTLDEELSQAEYMKALLQTQIGLNIFGYGFDTVRYWELPAHGCLLLAERLPIRIPNNFEDGKSAVFFDHLEELEEKLRYYLDRPEEAAAIARAGHAHLKKYHAGSVRARQLLGWVQQFA